MATDYLQEVEDFLGSSDVKEHGSILNVLDYFNRPRYAMLNALQGKDWHTGWTGEERPEWGDVLDKYIPWFRDNESDSWAEKGIKKGIKFGADFILDPINFIPANKAIGVIGKGAEWAVPNWAGKLYGTGLGLRFGHKLPEAYKPIEESIFEATRKGRTVAVDATDAFKTAQQTIDPFITKLQADVLAAGGTEADAARELAQFWHAFESGQQIPERFNPLVQAIEPLKGIRDAERTTWKEMLERAGLDVPRDVNISGEFLPHTMTPAGVREQSRFAKGGGSFGDVPYNPNAAEQASRDIFKWTDAEGNLLMRGNDPLITKAGDLRGGIIKKNVDGKDVYIDVAGIDKPRITSDGGVVLVNGQPARIVNPAQATLLEKMNITNPVAWETNPAKALIKDLEETNKKTNYLRVLESLQDAGVIKNIDEIAGAEDKFRQLGIKGFENFFVEDPAIWNRLQNLGRNAFGKDAAQMPWDVNLLDSIAGSKAGQALKEATGWWKRNQLALFPGWMASNIGSNAWLSWFAGMPFARQPYRAVEAAKVLQGTGDDVLKGMSNADLLKQLQYRDTSGQLANWYTTHEADPKTAERLKGIGVPETMADAAQWVASKWGDANRFGFKVNSGIEDHQRTALLIDWMKKNAPDFATASPDEKAKLLDQAAMFAEDSLVKLGSRWVPAYEKNLETIIPFWQWQRGMVEQFGKQALTNPKKLAKAEKIMEKIFMPMGSDEYHLADPNVKESAPTMGIHGIGTWDEIARKLGIPERDDAGTRMFQYGRFTPWGVIEQLASRPTDAVASFVNPFLKAPVELAGNWDYFKGRPIDPIAEGLARPLINPLYGGPYTPAQTTWFGSDWNPSAGWEKVNRSMPWSRWFDLVQTMGRGALWSEDPYKQPMTPIEKGAYWLTGGKFYPFDETRAYTNKINEYTRQLTAIKKGLKLTQQKDAEHAQEKYAEMLAEMLSKGPDI